MRQIKPHPVWLGHAGDSRSFAQVHDLGIQALVQLAVEEPVIQPPRELIYFRIPLIDGEGNRADTLSLAIQTVGELLTRRVPTLVCCGAGLSRSPCIVAGALAVSSGRSFDACLSLVTSQGPSDLSSSLCNDI